MRLNIKYEPLASKNNIYIAKYEGRLYIVVVLYRRDQWMPDANNIRAVHGNDTAFCRHQSLHRRNTPAEEINDNVLPKCRK